MPRGLPTPADEGFIPLRRKQKSLKPCDCKGLRDSVRVEVAGFEPAAFWSRTKRATKLRYTSLSAITALQRRWLRSAIAGNRCRLSGKPDLMRANRGTRTLDLLITNQLLYQLSHIGTS